MIRDTVPALERTLAAHLHPPVTATQSGFATISRAPQQESLTASERAELLAAPLLIIVLLLVFRSVVAAAIPLVLGAMTVLTGRGILVVLSSLMRIDALSLVVCTMMGLALGVDTRSSSFPASARSWQPDTIRPRLRFAAAAPPGAPLPSPDLPSSSLSSPRRSSSRAHCSFRSPPLWSSSLRSASPSRGVPCPPSSPCSGRASMLAASAAALRPPKARCPGGSPLRRPLRCGAPPSLRRRSRSPWRCLPRPR